MRFTQRTVEKVWAKAYPVGSFDPDYLRKDESGAWITKDQYGNKQSVFGWEIRHIKPLSDGGARKVSNLRPIQLRSRVIGYLNKEKHSNYSVGKNAISINQ